jgi:hypothetical protein
MHFKHPEILYFLFLLIVPILVRSFISPYFKKNISPMFVFLKALLYSNQKELTNKEMVAPHLPITLLLFIILALHSLF